MKSTDISATSRSSTVVPYLHNDSSPILAADGEGAIQVWDVASEAVTHRLMGHEGAITALVASGRSRLAVSAGQDGTLRLWSLPRIGEQ